MKKAYLVLSDGLVFEGRALGAEGEVIGEVVFNTAMTGYQEILTDPSYKGQIVVMTYTQIGNYGVNEYDVESNGGIRAEGFVVKESCRFPSNWRSKMSLGDYLRINNKIAIEGVDTRALTAHLRDNGSQMGIISTEDSSVENLLKKVRSHPGIGGLDLVKYETTDRVHSYREGIWSWERGCYPHIDDEKAEYSILVYDFGVKLNILRNLVSSGFKTIVVPASTPAEEVLNIDPDAILLSNGPGNPAIVAYAIENTKKLIGKKPLFGICFGHQIIGLALGGEVYKLKFGHHGANHPVKDLYTGKVEITSQNHNYCVDIKSLKGAVELTHRNLYDGTEEGLRHKELPIFSVQYHPEASPGPNDSSYIFRRFRDIVRTS